VRTDVIAYRGQAAHISVAFDHGVEGGLTKRLARLVPHARRGWSYADRRCTPMKNTQRLSGTLAMA